ncbi:SpoIIE family protein phosphatase [Streptomyces chengbuensis]|uniref:PP2C family protein-serine/threonine phosphatase n=1 Tax=Streptomyces TaxID=1883 RepID=UPI0025B2E0E2|nr:SpoIIE family protein phosphatase [Streptomyces sp. HUAS CB01]WJY53633.1 SpoIIE family protein phosphatase [Streptomyces sp. HUAS CB01]
MSNQDTVGEAAPFDVDYEAVFRAMPGPALLLTPDLVMVDANDAFLERSGRDRGDLVGRSAFEVFPVDPADSDAPGSRLRASVDRVLTTVRQDTMTLRRYDLESPGRAEPWERRFWTPANAPVLGPDGRVALIISRVEDVTELVRIRAALREAGKALSDEEAMTAGLLSQSQDLQELNERLRLAHAREREIAVSLQRAMLPSVPLGFGEVAVRYRPAVGSLNVCGDWYDVLDLGQDRLAVAVGDVVGHGLEAAGVMGQLRSALSAAVRATGEPATALKTLALQTPTIEGAVAATALQTIVDRTAHTITYSRAGHPPPLLLHPDGCTADVLDEVVDPPLGVWDLDAVRSQASLAYEPGATLVLYTDGLIERRGEDIDTGLARLTDSLTQHCGLGPEALASALLADLHPRGNSPDDDTALVVVRL